MLGTSRKMPNFFILGAKRAGTASMAHYLGQHPAIQFTEPRDPSFFLKDELYQKGLDFYTRSFCRNSGDQRWLGEASPSYLANPHIVGPRLRTHYGDYPLKFIVLLREPVSRAWSHYLHQASHGYEERDFATALAQDYLEPHYSDARYYAEGRYSHLLKEWQAYYPLENFLLLLSEDLAANPLAQVRRVFMWLGVDTTMPVNVSDRLNRARYTRSPRMVQFLNHPPAWLGSFGKHLWPEAWQRQRVRRRLRLPFQSAYNTLPSIDTAIAADLRRRYRSDVLALSKMLGRYLSHWLSEEELLEMPMAQMAYERIP